MSQIPIGWLMKKEEEGFWSKSPEKQQVSMMIDVINLYQLQAIRSGIFSSDSKTMPVTSQKVWIPSGYD